MTLETTATPTDSWNLEELAEFVIFNIRKTATLVWQIGKALSIAQARLTKTGGFLKWLRGVGITKSTAYRYLDIYNAYTGSAVLEGMSVTDAQRLIQTTAAKDEKSEGDDKPLGMDPAIRYWGESMSGERSVVQDVDQQHDDAESFPDDDENVPYSWAVNSSHGLFQEVKLAIVSISAAVQAWDDFSDDEREDLTARLRMLWPQVAPLIGESSAA